MWNKENRQHSSAAPGCLIIVFLTSLHWNSVLYSLDTFVTRVCSKQLPALQPDVHPLAFVLIPSALAVRTSHLFSFMRLQCKCSELSLKDNLRNLLRLHLEKKASEMSPKQRDFLPSLAMIVNPRDPQSRRELIPASFLLMAKWEYWCTHMYPSTLLMGYLPSPSLVLFNHVGGS